MVTFMGAGASAKANAIHQDLRGKHFVVTGANTGMGYVTSRELAKMGATVTLACRSADRGRDAIDKLRNEALATPVAEGVPLLAGVLDVNVQLEILDLGSLQSVVSFAQRFRASGVKVDVLINNAGVMATPEERTVDGLERQIGVNHFGGHLLTRLMEPVIVDGGRVIFLTSIAHERMPFQPKTTLDFDNINYDRPEKSYATWMAYSRSKLANVLDAKEFAKHLAGRRINTYAVHPGIANTDLFRNTAGSSILSLVMRLTRPAMKYVFTTPLAGALTTLRCAIDPTLVGPELSGKYWGNMKEEKASALATDPANPPRLWKITEDLLEAKLGNSIEKLLLQTPEKG